MNSRNQSTMPSITLVMPAYQEAGNLEGAYETVTRALYRAGVSDYEILILTATTVQGPHDGTPDIADRIAAKDPRVRVKHYGYTSLGYRFREGIRMATKTYITMMPAHNLTEEYSEAALFQLMGKSDAIIAYTENTGTRPLRARIVSRGFVELCNLLFGLNLRYYNGIAILRTDLVRRVPMSADNHAYMAEILVYLLKSGATYIQSTQSIKPSTRTGKEFHLKSAVACSQSLLSLFWKIHFQRIRIKV